MKLYLVRHSQTNYNLTGILDSSLSEKVHLTDDGIEQTQRLAAELKDVDFDAVYISELLRTRQTADIINTFHNAPVKVDPLLNEYRTGFEGKYVDEWLAAIDASSDKWGERFGDGESLNDVAERTKKFLETVTATHYDTVLVVTHGFVVQVMSALLHGHPHYEAFDYDVPQGKYEAFNVKQGDVYV